MAPLLLAHAQERAHDAPFVGRIVLPGAAVLPLVEELIVPIEGTQKRGLGQLAEISQGIDADGRGCDIEIPELHRARDVIDLMQGHALVDGGVEVISKGIAGGRDFLGVGILAQDRREARGVLEPPQDEEIVPVGVHGARGIALVADGLRDQAIVRALLIGPVRLGDALAAHVFDVIDGLHDVRPHLDEEAHVARVPVVLHDEIDPLPVAVVLGYRIGTAPIDAAGDPAVAELILGIPADEISCFVRVAHAQQRGRDERSVADPGALIGARAGLDPGTVLVDQGIGQRGTQGVGDLPGRLRQAKLDPV